MSTCNEVRTHPFPPSKHASDGPTRPLPQTRPTTDRFHKLSPWVCREARKPQGRKVVVSNMPPREARAKTLSPFNVKDAMQDQERRGPLHPDIRKRCPGHTQGLHKCASSQLCIHPPAHPPSQPVTRPPARSPLTHAPALPPAPRERVEVPPTPTSQHQHLPPPLEPQEIQGLQAFSVAQRTRGPEARGPYKRSSAGPTQEPAPGRTWGGAGATSVTPGRSGAWAASVSLGFGSRAGRQTARAHTQGRPLSPEASRNGRKLRAHRRKRHKALPAPETPCVRLASEV